MREGQQKRRRKEHPAKGWKAVAMSKVTRTNVIQPELRGNVKQPPIAG
jgi:hypothetical protein